MTRRLPVPVSLTVLVAALIAAGGVTAQGRLPSDADIKAILTPRLDPRVDLGIVVGVVEPGGRPRVVAAGRAGPGSRPPLDGNTLFEIGSATKIFTALVLADMVARGEVKLEDPVQQYLPPEVRMPARAGKAITLANLATHRSGLPRLPANLNPADRFNPYADYTVDEMYAFLSGYELPRDIGERYEYSNLGAGLLGHVLARRAGTAYEQLVTRRVLEPLGMRDTRIALTPALKTRLAVPHFVTGVPAANWDIPALAGAGALKSTVNDMLKFAEANLRPKGRLAPAIEQAQAVRYPAGSEEMGIGLAWHVRSRFDRPIVWHNGGTGGYHSFIGLDRAAGTAVVILHNSAGNIDDIGFHLLDSRYALTPADQLPKIRVPVALAPDRLDACVGEYAITSTVSATVSRQGDTLLFTVTNQGTIEILPESETEFFVKAADVQVVFVKGESGAFTELLLRQAGREARGRRK